MLVKGATDDNWFQLVVSDMHTKITIDAFKWFFLCSEVEIYHKGTFPHR